MYDDIFEINDLSNLKLVNINGIDIYTMDNFYKFPDKVYEYICSVEPHVHKQNEIGSYNGIYFEDRRHFIIDERISKTISSLSKILNSSVMYPNAIVTNFTRFINNKFNDYENSYWWPHTDSRYNAIIYLNKDIDEEHDGTSIYYKLKNYEPIGSEHSNPWQPKECWQEVVNIKAFYNRLVIFEGNQYHAMRISDRRFFGETFDQAKFRINQVIFFD